MLLSRRQTRLNETIRRILGQIINEEISRSDALITIIDAEVSVDIQWVDVLVSIFPYHKNEEIMKILNKKIGFLQGIFNKKLRIRHTPKIRFILDSRLEAGITEGA